MNVTKDNKLISIIIPTLDEKHINTTLSMLKESTTATPIEIILVDASSNPLKLSEIAMATEFPFPIKIVHSKKGRSIQMNKGGASTKGDYLLFLHADTRLPSGWDILVKRSLSHRDYGCFKKVFDSENLVLQILAMYSNLKSRVYKEILGDSCFFVRAPIFSQIGGFPAIALMEDVAISKLLRRYRFAYVNVATITSARRFRKYGTIRMILLMTILRIRYFFGADPRRLEESYR